MDSIKARAFSTREKHRLGGHGKPYLVGWPPQNREQRRLAERERKRAEKKNRKEK